MSIDRVIKRNGVVVPFDRRRIEDAIYAAAQAVGNGDGRQWSEMLSWAVVGILEQQYGPNGADVDVEQVQDVVEKVLVKSGNAEVTKAYILYRQRRAEARAGRQMLLDADRLVDDYLQRADWRVNENSNMNYSLQGLNFYLASSIAARYWLHKIYPPEVQEAHVSGALHLHDLGMLSVYCCGWDLQDLLIQGFGGVSAKIESRPPRHLRTALGQLVNFFYTLQGESAGAVAVSNFDTLLAPFVRYDRLSYAQIRQAVQEFVFNINVPTRVGFQCPFTNLTMDLTPPSTLSRQPVIVGGEVRQETYGDFQVEMDLINRAFAEVMLEGDARSRVFTFPIPTYNISPDFEWDNPQLEPVWAITARYGIPYFANFVNSDMHPEDARSMCLHPQELLLVKDGQGCVKKMAVADVFDEYRGRPIDSEWFDCEPGLEALSLNPETGKVEWSRIVRFLKTQHDELVTIRAQDGKQMRVSGHHPVAVFTRDGITTKKARDVTLQDFLVVLKNGSRAMNTVDDLDLDWAWFIGFFIADGNYLRDARYTHRPLRGVQLAFDARNTALIDRVRAFAREHLDYDVKFVLDHRYENSLRGYIYRSEFARRMSVEHDVQKYGRLPGWIWSASPDVVKAFLSGFFDGDGYENGREIHINDQGLARELNLLLQFVGSSTTFSMRSKSQVIRIQHVLGRSACGDRVVRDTVHNSVPQFMLDKKYVRDEHGTMLYQSYGCKQVGLSSIDRWQLSTPGIEALRKADYAVVQVDSITRESLDSQQDFYDIELDRNHYFVHSDGNITHNCCRLRLDNRELRKRMGGLFAAAPLTGSVGVVTINLPRLGHVARDEVDFLHRLEDLMQVARLSLEIKRQILERFTDIGLYPYGRHYLHDVKQRTGGYWSNHFSTIGLIGMNEACLNLLGVGIGDPAGKALAVRTLDFMRDVLTRFQHETGNLYNLEATPAEGASYRLARADKERYPAIVTAGTEHAPYYTNSTHLPVSYSDDLFEVLEHQDALQTRYTGGTVQHIFLGEQLDDWRQARRLVRTVAENFHLPYFTLTPTFSVCPVHGYIPGNHPCCPYDHTPEELARYGRPIRKS